MLRGLFLFLLAVHQLSNDFCHEEKQHANPSPSPFYLPLSSPLPSADSTLLNADQPLHSSFTLSLVWGDGNCTFPIQSVIGEQRVLPSVHAFPIAGSHNIPVLWSRHLSCWRACLMIYETCQYLEQTGRGTVGSQRWKRATLGVYVPQVCFPAIGERKTSKEMSVIHTYVYVYT